MDWRALLVLVAGLSVGVARAQALPDESGEDDSAPAPQIERLPGDMTLTGLFELVRRIDPQAQVQGNAAQFTVNDRGLVLVGDERAGRMRIMSPIARADALDEEILQRMLQANFDAVLDARYAIANGIVWSVFIHPLPPMDEAQFANAVSQVFVAASTFGSAYTSGALIYGGGDTNEEHRKVLEALKRRLEPQI
ncbi:MAG: hypothetical protein NW204_00500 [Xanthomonadaceae bacterium]|nr:hypothetical protein [Xanthomonadaceae bacterium]